MAEQTLPEDKDVAITYLENESKKHENTLKSGILGRFIGTGSESAFHIAGVISLFIVLAGVTYTFIPNTSNQGLTVNEFWQILSPILLTLLGYMFGKSQKVSGDK